MSTVSWPGISPAPARDGTPPFLRRRFRRWAKTRLRPFALFRTVTLCIALVTSVLLAATQGPETASAASSGNTTSAYVANEASGTLSVVAEGATSPSTTIQVGSQPVAVAITPDGSIAFVADYGSSTVTPIATAVSVAGVPIQVGDNPEALAITPNGQTLYVANSGSDSITPVSIPDADNAGTPIKLATSPTQLAITPNGATLYVLSKQAGTVTPITIATGAVGTPIPIGTKPTAIAITPNGKAAYVTLESNNSLVPITTSTNAVGAPIPVGDEPISIAVTPSGKTAYVANLGSSTVVPITLKTRAVGRAIAVPPDPVGVAVTPDGTTVDVTSLADNTVTPIATTTDTVGSPATVGASPAGLAIAPDQAPKAAFDITPAPTDEPTLFDASPSVVPGAAIESYKWNFGDGHSTTTTVPSTTHTYAAAGNYSVTLTLVDEDGTSLTQVFTGQTVSLDGDPGAETSQSVEIFDSTPGPAPTLYVANGESDTVTPVNTATNTPGAPIPVGDDPDSIAISPNGLTAWVANLGTAQSTNCQGSVTPIATSTNTAEAPVYTGECDVDAVAATPDGYVDVVHVSNLQTSASAAYEFLPAYANQGATLSLNNFVKTFGIVPYESDTAFGANPYSNSVSVYGPNYMGDTSLHIGTGTTAVAVTPDQNIVYMGTVNNEVIPVSVIPGVNYLTVGTPIQVGYDPDALAISPNGQTLWVANAGSDTVQPIDIASGTAGSAISVGDDPDALAIAPNGKTLYVANYDSGSVTPVNTVTDTAGTAIPVGAAPQALAITPDQGPVASFSDTTANLGTATTFNATGSTTPGAPIVRYAWNFGDGKSDTTTVPTVSHVYGAVGSYTATLTITDADGTSTSNVFTGQTTNLNGGSSAETSVNVVVNPRVET